MQLPSLSIKSKLVIMLLSVSLLSILVVGIQGLRNGKNAITERINSQLTSVRETKKNQIESLFVDVRNTINALSVDHTAVGAMREFAAAYKRLDTAVIDDSQLDRLKKFYTDEYLAELAKNIDGEPTVEQYLPSENQAQYLQTHYISDNPEKRGEKYKLNMAKDQSYYSGVHDYYHPVFSNLIQTHGFYDLFLIDIETGSVVYSVGKEADYATSLKNGPYRTSNLARLYQRIKESQDLGNTQVEDFDFYRPSYNSPAAFAGTTIFNAENKPEGILVVQLAVDEINEVMTGNRQWKAQGMGETGEVFLVGKNSTFGGGARELTMRSDSRFLLQKQGADTACYRKVQAVDGHIDPVAEKICRLGTSVLYQEIDNAAVVSAQGGDAGTAVVNSYHGNEVLTAFTKLDIPGLDWLIMAEISTDEADKPVRSFQRQLAISAVILSSLITFLAMWFAQMITNPLSKILEGVRKLGNNQTNVKVDVSRNDEFGELATTFNRTVDLIHKQNTTIDEKSKENRALLENILPSAIANRVLKGEQHIADRVSNVTILFTSMSGFNEFAEHLDPDVVVKKLNQLVNEFDHAAHKLGVEKIKTIGDSYMAASGLTIPRLDHAKRSIEFAREMLEIAERFNKRNDAKLGLRIGLHCGPVIAGVVGERKFVYDVWGDTVNIASRIRFEAVRNSLMVTNEVYQRLEIKDGFVEQHSVLTKGMGDLKTWQWEPSWATEDADTEVFEKPEDSIIHSKTVE